MIMYRFLLKKKNVCKIKRTKKEPKKEPSCLKKN